MNLRKILEAKVDSYLAEAKGIFKAAGRKRAQEYKATFADKDDNQLFADVFSDASNTEGKALGSSEDLRVFLMLALCQYKNISDQEIQNVKQAIKQEAFDMAIAMAKNATPYFVSISSPNENIMLITKLKKLLNDIHGVRDDKDIEMKAFQKR